LRAVVRASSAHGEVPAPPSKSYTHRALFAALLARGETVIENPLVSGDTRASLRAVRLFGARASWTRVVSDGEPRQPPDVVHCLRSATTARFSIAVASLVDGLTVVTGSRSLRERPMQHLVEALRAMGVEAHSRSGRLPVAVVGGLRRPLSEEVEVEGTVSSQFVSALLLIAPRLGVRLRVRGRMKSRPYVDVTLRTLRSFGVEVEEVDRGVFAADEQDYEAARFKVPGDYSSASFILSLGALCGRVRVVGLDPGDVQADRRILDILKEMGAHVRVGEGFVEVEEGELEGLTVDCNDTPDLVPVIAVLGAYARGRTVVRGAEHLRLKESDRLSSLAQNLRRMGAEVEELEDGLAIKGGGGLRGAVVDPRYDHRIAMALAIAALRAEGETTILNAECVKDSYPQFFEHLASLNCDVRVEK